ncbi:hypothetical protein MtrunA17_Chr1g0196551 [Medicago truncatula]|uniref:Uncharacterized protein n=1 Tax=Medicago truncatula TaxID=3880 RepID=G7I2W8_MEDTR|nr:uncharacterized protein LOC11410237 [Medicago truncatula]AES61873.1 hypothetical protein MTR_1g089890 [Medicago truncatula]RHN81206.1 hypothetical protein MtrunA17_Chr1g0196551 [Medicago truncatula]
MENNNSSSNSSVCTKIRHAFASSPALRAIQRISSFNQEHKHVTNGSNSPPKANNVKTKPHQTKPHHKAQTETSSEVIPIKFDYSTPTYKQNGNSSAVSSVAKSAPTHVGNSERTKVSAKSELPQPQQYVPKKVVAQNGNQHGKESMDINETFKEYIQRAKKKIRTVSNIGRGQNNPAAAPDHEVHHDTTTSGKNESLEEHFQDFIHRAKKKIRATTMVGRRN